MNYVILGERQTQAALAKKLGVSLATTGPSVAAGGQVIARTMAALAPKRTGRLAGSIDVSVDQEADEATAHIGATAPYDRFVQLGTRHMSAQEYGERAAAAASAPAAAAVAAVYKRVL